MSPAQQVLERLAASLQAAEHDAGVGLERVGQALEAAAKKTAPGGSAQRIRWQRTTPTSGQLSYPQHAQYSEEGTKPHAIVPRTKHALAFPWGPAAGGRAVFKRVQHPGTPATHWLARAWADPAVQQAIRDLPRGWVLNP